MNKSTIPVETGVPNPFFAKAVELLSSVGEVQSLVAQIQAVARGHRRDRPGKSAYDIEAILKICGSNGVKQQLREVFDRVGSAARTPVVLGPPPPAKQLYGRFGSGLEVVDVGSGNGRKLRHYTGTLKITCVDPGLDVDTRHVFAGCFKATFKDFLMMEGLPKEPLLTSFMSLCQLSPVEQDQVLMFDGLHMLPDHQLLEKNKVAVRVEGGKYRVKTQRRDFEDFELPTGGYEVETGYRLYASFAMRDIEVVAKSAGEDTEPVHVDCCPASFLDLNFQDAGYKFHGYPVELECLPTGESYVTDRAGRVQQGTHDAGFYFSLHLENMGEYLVLLRIVIWRGYIPPHCGEVLRLFANRVRLKINGKPVYGPPVWKPGVDCRLTSDFFEPVVESRIDGIISRLDEKDLYAKEKWTLDFRPSDVVKFTELGVKHGFKVSASEVRDGLWEYEADKRGSEVRLFPVRFRDDKILSTTVETAEYMLEKLDLGEYAALVGSPAILC